ncbi:MAG TPA: type II toxin-antitoxin system VapC family toxin [Intrasporangium sp.]|uniref:type II toxin-antitoxin system VapC family toxin n=1 Tax=Intrasporangium sp. TaxID=1925024 RepID=UPI002F91D861
MVVDTSALAAIVLGESDAERYLDALTLSEQVIRVAAVTAVEVAIVVEARQGPEAGRDLRLLLDQLGAQVMPCDEVQVTAAIAAWRRFGKGRHPAQLNLGDCFSYALAQAMAEPLLFKGNDFSQTDVRAAVG